MRPTVALVLVCAGLALLPRLAPAQTVTFNSVSLTWTAPGDDSLSGTASQYDLRYSISPITATNFASASRFTGTPNPSPSGTTEHVTVTGLASATTYYFALKTGDEVPNWSGISNVISRATLSAPDGIRPAPIATVTITGTTESSATMRWTAVGDDSLTGTATSYDVRYSTSPITEEDGADPAGFGRGRANPATAQNMTVVSLTRQTTYYFAVKVADRPAVGALECRQRHDPRPDDARGGAGPGGGLPRVPVGPRLAGVRGGRASRARALAWLRGTVEAAWTSGFRATGPPAGRAGRSSRRRSCWRWRSPPRSRRHRRLALKRWPTA